MQLWWIFLSLKLALLTNTVAAFNPLRSKDGFFRKENEVASINVGSPLHQSSFETMQEIVRETNSDVTSFPRDVKLAPGRSRRDLGGASGPFGTPDRFRWKVKPRKPSKTQTSGKGDDDRVAYTYKFWGDNFTLKGNVSVLQYGNKLRVLFRYIVSGSVNATMEIVRQSLKDTFEKWPPGTSAAMRRPRNCHFQSKDNRSEFVRSNLKCSQPLTKQKPLNNPINNNNGIFPVPAPLRSKEDTILPSYDPSRRSCGVRRTTYRKSWLCISPAYPPCFLLRVQDSDYVVTETICPKRLLNLAGNSPAKKLYGLK